MFTLLFLFESDEFGGDYQVFGGCYDSFEEAKKNAITFNLKVEDDEHKATFEESKYEELSFPKLNYGKRPKSVTKFNFKEEFNFHSYIAYVIEY